MVAATALIERAFGKPRDYDPKRDAERPKPVFDPRAYTPAELEQLEIALKLLMEGRQVAAPEARPRSQMQTASRSNDSAGARSSSDFSSALIKAQADLQPPLIAAGYVLPPLSFGGALVARP